MCNVKWVGTPARYTRSRCVRKRTDRWPMSAPVQSISDESKDAAYWLSVVGVFALCIGVMCWVALISA